MDKDTVAYFLLSVGRTEVLPVQWRKTLHIEADALCRQLMPPGIPSLRQVQRVG